MTELTKRISAAVLDGRAQNTYYEQSQLKKLHKALVSSRSDIKKALRNDSGNTPAEIEAEYSLTLAFVREQYAALDADQELETEYSLANRKDQPSRIVAVGSVYLVPSTRHSVLYSTVAPLSVAIAAGNCVIVELKQTISELNSLLRQTLSEALSPDTFAIVDSRPNDPEFFSTCTIVQDFADENHDPLKQIICSATPRVVAIVDRTADLKEAAAEIVRARISFQGRSPYAPDLVLVNEFALKDFCSAAVQSATSHFSGQVDAFANGSAMKPQQRKVDGGVSAKELSEGDVETLVSASRGSVVLARKRESQLLGRKIGEPLLLVHAVSSLDDAIDTVNSRSSEPLLATYLFGAPPVAKYLSQFVSSRMSCVNKVPVELLIGPANPASVIPSIDINSRFTKSMFTRPHPEYINFSPRSVLLSQLLDDGSGNTAMEKLVQQFQMPLPEKKRVAEHQNIGFFEQGILSGVAVVGTGILASLATVGVWGWRRMR